MIWYGSTPIQTVVLSEQDAGGPKQQNKQLHSKSMKRNKHRNSKEERAAEGKGVLLQHIKHWASENHSCCLCLHQPTNKHYTGCLRQSLDAIICCCPIHENITGQNVHVPNKYSVTHQICRQLKGPGPYFLHVNDWWGQKYLELL